MILTAMNLDELRDESSIFFSRKEIEDCFEHGNGYTDVLDKVSSAVKANRKKGMNNE